MRDGEEVASPHGGMAFRGKEDASKEPPTLQEEIADDPYVDEGMALLLSLLAKQG